MKKQLVFDKDRYEKTKRRPKLITLIKKMAFVLIKKMAFILLFGSSESQMAETTVIRVNVVIESSKKIERP